MRFVDGNDYGSDGGDDVSAPKQPGEIPGVVALMKSEIEEASQPGGGGFKKRRRPTDRMKE